MAKGYRAGCMDRELVLDANTDHVLSGWLPQEAILFSEAHPSRRKQRHALAGTTVT